MNIDIEANLCDYQCSFVFTKAVYSTCGMMTSPLFQLGKSAPVVYNLWVTPTNFN